MKNILKTLEVLFLLIVLAGCGSTQTQTKTGNLTLAGSTSMEKLCEALSESFMEDYDINVTIEYTGSSAGAESLSSGLVEIGNLSRKLKEGETEKGLVGNVVAIDGIVIIVDVNNTIDNLSSEQLAEIYTGKVTNWKQLGGKDEPIVLIGREAGSGTRDAFEEILEIKDECKYVQELDSTGAVLARVSSIEGAIGYVSLDVVNENVKQIKIDGVEGSEEEISAGNYLLQRPFIMATKGEIADQNENVQTWFEFIQSDKGKQIIEQVGLIIPKK